MVSVLGWLVLVVLAVLAANKGHKKTRQTLLGDWFAVTENATENKVAKFGLIFVGVVCLLTHKMVAGLLELAYDARYWLDKNLGELGYNLKYSPKGCGISEPEPAKDEPSE